MIVIVLFGIINFVRYRAALILSRKTKFAYKYRNDKKKN